MRISEFTEKKDTFLDHLKIERNMSHNTVRAYAADLKQFIEFWNEIERTEQQALPLQQTIERFFVHLYYKKIDKSSIARKMSCFKSFEKFIKTFGKDLSLKLTRPRVDKKLPVYLSVDEIFHLLDTVQDSDLPGRHPKRDKAILELLYATGIRCSELIGIHIRDINIEDKVIRIYGKGRKERIALFGEKAKARIIEYLSEERPHTTNRDEHLFVSYRNTPLTTRSVQRIFEMFRKFLKVDRHITPHKIRHSFATHLLNQGVDLRVVQELLGHKTLASTERYTHVTSAQLAEMCDTIHPIHDMTKKVPAE
ncbi:tyrosine-type recombinase/integrase [Candidatus Babeliales bacterium]|nr:tyrosine-type recombinase/integrase [Candidatus Babeliales bacterium]